MHSSFHNIYSLYNHEDSYRNDKFFKSSNIIKNLRLILLPEMYEYDHKAVGNAAVGSRKITVSFSIINIMISIFMISCVVVYSIAVILIIC